MRLAIPLLLLLGACKKSPEVLLPNVEAATFVDQVDNPFYPLPVGATWTFEAVTEDGVHVELMANIELPEEIDDALNVALVVGGSIVIPHLRHAVETVDLLRAREDHAD